MDIVLVLLIIAVVLFGLAAFGVHSPVHLGWAGLCLVALAFVLERT